MCLALYALRATLGLCPHCCVTFARAGFHRPNLRHKLSWFVFPTGPVNSTVFFFFFRSGQIFVKSFQRLKQCIDLRPVSNSAQPSCPQLSHRARSWRQRDQGWRAADTQPRTAATFPCFSFPSLLQSSPASPSSVIPGDAFILSEESDQPMSAAEAHGSLAGGAGEEALCSALSLFCTEVHSSTA